MATFLKGANWAFVPAVCVIIAPNFPFRRSVRQVESYSPRTDDFASENIRARQEPAISERKVAKSAAPAHVHSSHAAHEATGTAECISYA